MGWRAILPDLSQTGGEWSIFSVGLQSDLVYNGVIQHVAPRRALRRDSRCEHELHGEYGFRSGQPSFQTRRRRGWLTVFRSSRSADLPRRRACGRYWGVRGRVDQDDMISLFRVHNAGLRFRPGP